MIAEALKLLSAQYSAQSSKLILRCKERLYFSLWSSRFGIMECANYKFGVLCPVMSGSSLLAPSRYWVPVELSLIENIAWYQFFCLASNLGQGGSWKKRGRICKDSWIKYIAPKELDERSVRVLSVAVQSAALNSEEWINGPGDCLSMCPDHMHTEPGYDAIKFTKLTAFINLLMSKDSCTEQFWTYDMDFVSLWPM